MTVHPQHVEAEFNCVLHQLSHVLVACASEQCVNGHEVCSLEEHPLTVDGARPVVPCHFSKAGAAMGCIAWVPIDGDDHIDIDEVLVSEISGPPKSRSWEINSP